MPNSKNVKALKTFSTRELAEVYREGCEAGLAHAPEAYGCSQPEPVRVRIESVPWRMHSVYIEVGYYTVNGGIVWT